MQKTLLALLLLCFVGFSQAQEAESATTEEELTEEELTALYQHYLDSISATLNFQEGQIDLKNGLATLQIPQGYKYLGPEESEMVLTDLWGNPPSEGEDRTLGMIFPADSGPNDHSSFAINITYSEEGYIDDADAKDLDYDDLLKTMQEGTKESNEYRKELGYEPIELIGWASAPFYDAADKKLHWAKELKFGDSPDHTLNYNIRVLGRKGYLELNAISEMPALAEVQNSIPSILPAVSFNDGNRYVDFDPSMDKVAAYGIGGLIAGKVLAKAGILAKIGLVLAKFWKLVVIGFIALVAGVRRLFTGKAEEKEMA